MEEKEQKTPQDTPTSLECWHNRVRVWCEVHDREVGKVKNKDEGQGSDFRVFEGKAIGVHVRRRGRGCHLWESKQRHRTNKQKRSTVRNLTNTHGVELP